MGSIVQHSSRHLVQHNDLNHSRVLVLHVENFRLDLSKSSLEECFRNCLTNITCQSNFLNQNKLTSLENNQLFCADESPQLFLLRLLDQGLFRQTLSFLHLKIKVDNLRLVLDNYYYVLTARLISQKFPAVNILLFSRKFTN